MRLQPGHSPHFGIRPGINLWPRRPVAFVESAKNQAVGTLHACLDRPENGQPWVGLPGPAHRFSGKKLGQDTWETVTIRLEAASLFGNRC